MSSCGALAQWAGAGHFFAANARPHVISRRPRHRGRTYDALHAGVAELVDALDLGSSDESCGGSSPSARTKRFQRLPDDLRRTLFPPGILVRQTTGARPSGRAPNILTISGPLTGRTNAEEDDDAGHRNPFR